MTYMSFHLSIIPPTESSEPGFYYCSLVFGPDYERKYGRYARSAQMAMAFTLDDMANDLKQKARADNG